METEDKEVTSCPYCGISNSFYREVKIWPISKMHCLNVDSKKVNVKGKAAGKKNRLAKLVAKLVTNSQSRLPFHDPDLTSRIVVKVIV